MTSMFPITFPSLRNEAPVHAVIDANVFVSVRTLDVILTCAQLGLAEVSWTNRIEDEVLETVGRLRPEALGGTARMIANANRAFPFAKLEDALEEPGYGLPDADDEHVLAAGVGCGADVLLTYNLKDFPVDVLVPMGITPMHPDDFLTRLLDADADEVVDALISLVKKKKRPPLTLDEELAFLRANKLCRFASGVEQTLVARG